MSGQSGGHRLLLSKLNDQLKCTLCSGYLIDATTIIECLHSFCRSCIVKYLEVNKYCPICEVLVHKSKPLLNIRPDHTLQDIVYKLVPGCYQNEMRCRREFYAKHPEGKNLQTPPESRGEPIESHIYSPDESLSLSLEYYSPSVNSDTDDEKELVTKILPRRYLRCPAAVTVFHLQKLIRSKYGLTDAHRIDIMYKEESLSGNYTLMDVMYIYHWRRKVPLHLSYRIFESSPKRLKIADDNNEFKQSLTNTGMSAIETREDQTTTTTTATTTTTTTKRGWKEVQLKISETGVMSVTDITSPDSKKGTTTTTKDNNTQNETTFVPSVNKSVDDDSLPRASSTTKVKNLLTEFDKKLPPSDAKRKENSDTKPQEERKREKRELPARETKNRENEPQPRELRDKKENKKRDPKIKKDETELITRLQMPEAEKTKKTENQKKNSTLAGSKIDALSAKLQFQPKVGQVNNTYAKKIVKKPRGGEKETKKETESPGQSKIVGENEKIEVEIEKKEKEMPKIVKELKNTGDGENGKKAEIALGNAIPTYVTAPSISSEKNCSKMTLQQAINSLGKTSDPKSLLGQLNFRNNNLPPSSEVLASTMMGPNFGYIMPDLGMLGSTKAQITPISPTNSGKSSQLPILTTTTTTTSTLATKMTTFNVQPSMSIYSISDKNNLNQSSSSSPSSSKSDFEITSVPISLMKSTRKHEVIAKGTNLNEICAKIGTSGSKINDICAKIGENSKEKNKTDTQRNLPDLLKITKSTEFLKHIPNIPNVPIYTPNNKGDKVMTGGGGGQKLQQQQQQKKHSHIGYKTLRDPPKSWNPTLSKNNYVAVKNQSQFDGSSSKPILSKPAKIFKMRNVPRYLGNPASGVKPMYGVSNEKEKEVKSNLTGNSMMMMKIDPKTLSPIVSSSNSPIVSPPPYSPNARNYQNSLFTREMCRNSGSPISPRNSPVNMLSTNPFIPSPTPNTNPRLIYSHFPPPFPDTSRFPNPLIRSPIGIPPPSAFHSSLPPSINKLYQRTNYIPQTSGYNPAVTQQTQQLALPPPPAVQRIPPSSTSSGSFTLGKSHELAIVSSSSEGTKEKIFNLSKVSEEGGEKTREERINLDTKVNGDIIDLEEEEKRKKSKKQNLRSNSEIGELKGALQVLKDLQQKNPANQSTMESQTNRSSSSSSTKETIPKETNQSKDLKNQSSNKEETNSSNETFQSSSGKNQSSSSSSSSSKEASLDPRFGGVDSSQSAKDDHRNDSLKESSKEMEVSKKTKDSITNDSGTKLINRENFTESINDSKKGEKIPSSATENSKEEAENPGEKMKENQQERSRENEKEKIEQVEKEIQVKKSSEIQRNEAES